MKSSLRNLTKHKYAIIGAGRAGSAVALALAMQGFHPSAIVDKKIKRAQTLAGWTGSPLALPDVKKLPAAISLILLAVPDDRIEEVVNDLLNQSALRWKHTVILHLSGATPSSVLAPLERRGAAGGSMHPVLSFPASTGILENARRLSGAIFVGEGKPMAKTVARQIASVLGGELLTIRQSAKPLYHAAAVFASNFLLASLHASETILRSIGLRRKHFLDALVNSTISGAMASSPAQALTGPIERGDFETVAGHWTAIQTRLPELLDLYKNLAAETAALAARSPSRRKRKGVTAQSERQRILDLFLHLEDPPPAESDDRRLS